MGQEDGEQFTLDKKESEDYIMLKKSKRTLSLVLALIMICSTMGVMAFAQERAITLECPCGSTRFAYSHTSNSFNRVIECPNHFGHDAEEWYIGEYYRCLDCGSWVFARTAIEYVCLI